MLAQHIFLGEVLVDRHEFESALADDLLTVTTSDGEIVPARKRALDPLPDPTPPVAGSLNELADEVHQISRSKGWHDETRSFGDLIALIHSEVSEALEEYRNGHDYNEIYYKIEVPAELGGGAAFVHRDGVWQTEDGREITHDMWRAAGATVKPEGIPVELADAIIRIGDVAATYGIDLDAAVREKIEFNKTRPMRHGGKVI